MQNKNRDEFVVMARAPDFIVTALIRRRLRRAVPDPWGRSRRELFWESVDAFSVCGFFVCTEPKAAGKDGF